MALLSDADLAFFFRRYSRIWCSINPKVHQRTFVSKREAPVIKTDKYPIDSARLVPLLRPRPLSIGKFWGNEHGSTADPGRSWYQFVVLAARRPLGINTFSVR